MYTEMKTLWKMHFVHVASPSNSMFALVSLLCSYADVGRAHTAWNVHCVHVRMHCSVGDRACACLWKNKRNSKMKLFPGGAASPVKDDHNTQESSEHTDTLSSYNYTTYYNTTAAPPPPLHTHTHTHTFAIQITVRLTLKCGCCNFVLMLFCLSPLSLYEYTNIWRIFTGIQVSSSVWRCQSLRGLFLSFHWDIEHV